MTDLRPSASPAASQAAGRRRLVLELAALAATIVVTVTAVLLVRAHLARPKDMVYRHPQRVLIGADPTWKGTGTSLEPVGTAAPEIRSLSVRPGREGMRVIAQVVDDDLVSVYLQRHDALEPLAPLVASPGGVYQARLAAAKDPRHYSLVAVDRGGRRTQQPVTVPPSP